MPSNSGARNRWRGLRHTSDRSHAGPEPAEPRKQISDTQAASARHLAKLRAAAPASPRRAVASLGLIACPRAVASLAADRVPRSGRFARALAARAPAAAIAA